MAIKLYAHNQEAYNNVIAMLMETGKAAVIHPTGTGKSYIAFKLCEDNPKARICWLSPSEYIFKTQCENIKESDGFEPKNIQFYTYAKLAYMSEEEIKEIKPDYIILDEFHRCGAQVWGQGIKRLLGTYKETPLLGLTATNIRYLDNQRDMAEELFENHIASEITLGEAIMRGILNPPKYVLSLYAYKGEIEKYQQKIKKIKNKTKRQTAEDQLEALRRALDKADGIDQIFEKHLPKKDGKYIIFCANYDHLTEMKPKVREWFKAIDKQPHIYTAYAEDKATEQQFQAFKTDNSHHLKLLFCIDMLNEGIHVTDVDGVILLRPTISPIIYKQQIGRALSAGTKTNAVIFDIVNNIEGLCSIDTIEEEIQIAMTYYQEQGQKEQIINEHFTIIDEVRNCIELFEKLTDTLTASWETMYQKAKEYYNQNKDLNVPKRYITEEGYALGSWLETQRKVYNKKINGNLSKEQIEKLNQIHMRWESISDINWNKYFNAAKTYYETNGNLQVPINNKTKSIVDGIDIGKWIANLRTYKKSSIKTNYLTQERIKALEEIGMIWDISDHIWETNINSLKAYQQEKGNTDVPYYYTDKNGIKLGKWLSSIKKAYRDPQNSNYRLSEEQIKQLNQLGINWHTKADQQWEKAYQAAKEYFEEYGHLEIPANYKTKEGYSLGKWVIRQRENKKNLSQDRKEKLNALHMRWTTPDPWEEKYQLLKEYYEEHGHLNIKYNEVINGVWLSKWLKEQLSRLNNTNPKKKPLTQEQRNKLLALELPQNKAKSHRKKSEAMPMEKTTRAKAVGMGW